MKKTKIICTIGPSSEDPRIIEELINCGMNAARLNFSHGDFEEHGPRIDNIKKLRERLKKPIAIMLDTKGPEIRTGKFKDGKVELVQGQQFTFTTRDIVGDSTVCHISYEGLPCDLKVNDTILVDDGLVGFNVEKLDDTEIICTVLNSGIIGNNKGVNVPGVDINLPALTQKDIDDILFGIEKGVDIIAVSFVRRPTDVLAIRRILEKHNAGGIAIISKIENRQGIDNIDEILKLSDGIMVARGDLGVEIPVEEVPLVQKMMIEKCNSMAKPVITATQMLDSMIRNPRPTRAEASDVANAIFDGTDCIMLSGETANGKYPVEAVKTMARIAERAEQSLDYMKRMKSRKIDRAESIPNAISFSACMTAAELGASAIITATMSGYTAKMVSKYRPEAPIIAITPFENIARKLNITWGVYPFVTAKMESADEIVDLSVERALESGYIKKGDLVVIVAGIPICYTGTTNMLKVHIVGDALVNGHGIGSDAVYGNARVIKSVEDIEKLVNDGDIIITKKFYKELVQVLDRITGIVSEEGGFTSHTAIECISRGIPVITAAENAADIIKSGTFITMDTSRGVVFSGKANVL